MVIELVQQEITQALKDSGLSAAKASRLASGNPSLIKNIMAGHMPRVDSLARLGDVLNTGFYIGPSNSPPPRLYTDAPDTEAGLPASKLARLENATRELVLSAVALGADHQFVPRYDVCLAPGRRMNETVDREPEAGYELFRRQWLRDQGLEGDALTVVDVVGNTMQPTLCDGDWALVDRSQHQLRHGGIFALSGSPVPLLRRIREEADVWWADCDNNRHPSLAISQHDEVIGRVVWWGHTEGR